MATKKPARKKTTKVPEYFVHMTADGAQDFALSSGEYVSSSLAEAQKDAVHVFDSNHYEYAEDVTETTIYKLVPVRKLTKPSEVVVIDL